MSPHETARQVLQFTPSEPDSEASAVNAVLSDEFHVPSWQDPKVLSKSRLRDEVERVTVGRLEDKLVYANSGRHGLLGKLEEMTTAIERLTAKDEQEIIQLEEHQKEITSLKGQIGRLIQSSEGLAIQMRSLDVYQRDIKSNEELKGSKAIQTGNLRAHEGDALGDAILFEHDGHSDRWLYRELYGLDFEQVLEFYSAGDDGGLFLVLNAHATMLVQGKTPSDDLETAFQSFLTQVEEHWLQPPNKEPNTPLGSAYYTFWRKFNEQALI